jgi:hypothetical protein
MAGALLTSDIELPIPPYTLGAWLGDGSSRNSQLTGQDAEIWERIERDGFKVVHYKWDRIAHNILGLATPLRKAGLLQNKHIPEIYLRSGVGQRLALLQGLMDTDGHAALDGGCEFDNINERLAMGVLELALSLGIKATILKGTAKLNGVTISDKWRVRFTTSLPVFGMQRKLERLNQSPRRTTLFRYLIGCEKVESVDTRCIAVDSPTRQYLAGSSLIPTHNTDVVVGSAITRHKRVLITRREKAQTEGAIQRLTEILGNTNGFNSTKAIWRFPVGSEPIIEFGGLDNLGDERRWQGRPHDLKCVAAGTMVWLADGTRKPIERVVVGDIVDTLAGPRRVSRTIESLRKAVEVIAYQNGVEVGRQIQGATHELLTTEGWVSSEFLRCQSESASPKLRRDARKSALQFAPTYSASEPLHANLCADLLPCVELPQYPEGCRYSLGTCGGTEGIGQGTSHAGLNVTHQAHALQVLCRRELPVQLAQLRGQEESAGDLACGVAYALSTSSLEDYQPNCLSAPRHGDEQPRPLLRGGQALFLQQGDAAQQTPNGLLVDAPGIAPKHSRRIWSYAHPYSKEIRSTDRGLRAVSFAYSDAGTLPLFDLTIEGENHYMTGAGFVNRNCFDEVTEMREAQVRFIMGWTRSNDPTVKPKVLMVFNPPTTAEGRWVIAFFAPWLDKKHPNPAIPGELRWFTTIGGKDKEVADGRPFVLIDGESVYDFNPDDYTAEQIIKAKSRTFIPARLTDNPYYMATDYMSTLQGLPEPLRSQMLYGDFNAGIEDDPWQVIPTAWVEAAQARWKRPDRLPEMDSMGVDVARGGKDTTVIARRHDNWFDEALVYDGTTTPDGPKVAGLVMASMRDGAPIHIDVIGVGSSPYDFLNSAGQPVIGVNVSESPTRTDKSGMLRFLNLRTQLWWLFREALDPANNMGLCLPPDPELLGDLCAPKWSLQGKVIKVEGRQEILARIGRSPDRASAYIMAQMDTPKIAHLRALSSKPCGEYDPYA